MKTSVFTILQINYIEVMIKNKDDVYYYAYIRRF